MRNPDRKRPPFVPPLDFAAASQKRTSYRPTPPILVRLAIRSLVSCRATAEPYPKPILSALDRRVRDGCPTAQVVRDLIERNGMVPSPARGDMPSDRELAR